MYGHQWASQQGDSPNDTWVRGMQDIGPTELTRGLTALLDRGEAWPPSLPEFRGLCRRQWREYIHKEWNPNAAIADKSDQTLLPQFTQAELEKTPAEHLADMRKLMGLKKTLDN